MAAASVLFWHTLSESEGVWGEGIAEALLLSLVKGGGERVLSFSFPISTDCALANVQHHLQCVRGEETPLQYCMRFTSSTDSSSHGLHS